MVRTERRFRPSIENGPVQRVKIEESTQHKWVNRTFTKFIQIYTVFAEELGERFRSVV